MDSFVNETICSKGHNNKIVQLIEVMVLDLKPLAMVEGTGLDRYLINYFEPGYRVPSTKYITQCLQENIYKPKAF